MDVVYNKSEVLQMNSNIVRMCHLWPKKGQKNNAFFKMKALIMCVLLGFLMHCASIHYVFNMYYGKKLEQYEKIEDMFILVSDIVITYIILCFIFRVDMLTNLVDALGDYTKFGKPSDADEANKKIDFFVKIHWIYTSIGVLVYGIYGVWQTKMCEEVKLKNGSLNICGLMSNTWFPFEIDYFPVKQIIWAMQVSATFGFMNVGSCSVSIVLASTEHVILRVEHFKDILTTIFTLDTMDKRRQRLSLCVRYHNYIIELTEQMDRCYRPIMFVHISLSAIIVATVGYVFLTTRSLKYMMYLVGCLIAVFMVCFAGQRLQDKSNEICWGIYSTAWYYGDAAIQRDVALMILRSQRDLGINAGGFGFMTYETFKVIIQSVYSYLTLIGATIK